MSRKNKAAFGIYADQTTVTEAVEALKAAGFRATDISVLLPENLGSKDFGHEKHTKAPEGAVTGGGSGALIGALVGYAAGAGAMFVPGLEPLAAAGPILGTFSGLGAGVILGGITGALVGAGIPEYEAKRFAGRVRKGGILLSVHCDNDEWTTIAAKTLKATGATDVAVASEARADFAHSEKPIPRNRVSHLS